MKGVPGQPHGARLVAAKFKVVSVQRLIVIAENGDAHENAAARLGPKCFVWTVNPFVLSLLFGSKPLLQTIDHFLWISLANGLRPCFKLHDFGHDSCLRPALAAAL